VERSGDYAYRVLRKDGLFGPKFKKTTGFKETNEYNEQHSCGLKTVDHVVGNVEEGNMNKWVDWYEQVLGFKMWQHFDAKDVSTEHSALMSKVMASGNGRIKMPINEPATGRAGKKSQIQEYIDWHGNQPGVQHVAMSSASIIDSVMEMRRRGLEFLRIPAMYYQALPQRIGKIRESLSRIEELGILVDRDDQGYLLQLFTRPVQDRPTLFYEVIQRRGSRSFGKGNFKALFEAIEKEQCERGNL
jgi:4-hydroxyphenylpyruvate dioxygenase